MTNLRIFLLLLLIILHVEYLQSSNSNVPWENEFEEPSNLDFTAYKPINDDLFISAPILRAKPNLPPEIIEGGGVNGIGRESTPVGNSIEVLFLLSALYLLFSVLKKNKVTSKMK